MDSNRPRLDLILKQLEQLPTLPTVAVRVLQAAQSDDSNVADVCRLIESDPALTTRILQLVHRADLGAPQSINTLERAVVMLGFDAIRCAVLAVSVFGVFSADNKASRFPRDAFWKHSIGVACCAELLAEEIASKTVDPGEAFVAGLLHDIGKLALDTAVPKSYAKVIETADVLRGNVADVERAVVGADHMIVGKRLAEQWQLPAQLRDVIWLHGQLPAALPASVRNRQLVNVVTLADLLMREQHIGYSGNYVYPVQRQILIDALGLVPAKLERVMANVVNAIEARASALGLGQTEAGEVYRAALQQANRELSRVTDQLSVRNRRLAMRAKYFEAIAAFQSELRPDAPPAVILQAIGHTASGVLERDAVAVFSQPPGAGYAEVVVVDRAGLIVQTNIINATATIAIQTTSSPVRKTDESTEWLLQQVSPALQGAGRFWVSLEADGQCVGGVIWGGDLGDEERLAPQTQELTALSVGWALALRTCQIRDEARALSEQLAESNRQLQSAQSEIIRTRMVTSVAEIAAGAAHEMNNPLAVISGRSQLLASTLSDPKHIDTARLIYEKSQVVSDLITSLMHFARPQAPSLELVSVVELVHAAIVEAKGSAETVDRHIEIDTGGLPEAFVDARQVSSAMAQIIANAVQATEPISGRIRIGASYDAIGKRVVLTVADNGQGMDEHVLRHAFDPFFSARKAGRGQGMGLAKAVRWIESSGGTVRLESGVGEGTRAVIILPTQ